MAKEKTVTAKQLLDAFTKYQAMLADDPKISETKFNHMQTAIYGCKCLVRDAFGLPRVTEFAMDK